MKIKILSFILFFIVNVYSSISITQIPDSSIFQFPHTARSPGTFPVISGTYTGSPTSISAQVRDYNNDTVVKAWTIINNSPTGGTFADTLKDISRGGPYRICVKTSIAGDSITGTTVWGVGEIIGIFGQSNAALHEVYHNNYNVTGYARKNINGSWQQMNSSWYSSGDSSKNTYVFTSMVESIFASIDTAYPIGVCGYAEGGTSMLTGSRYWAKRNSGNPSDTSTLYGKLLSKLVICKPYAIVMYQGESDYLSTTQSYIDSASSMFSNLTTDLGYKPIMCIIQTREITGNDRDAMLDTYEWRTIPEAQSQLCNDSTVLFAASTYNLKTYDGAHLDSTSEVDVGILTGKTLSYLYKDSIQFGYRFRIDSAVATEHGKINVYLKRPFNKPIININRFLFSYTDELNVNPVPAVTAILVNDTTISLVMCGKLFTGETLLQYGRYKTRAEKNVGVVFSNNIPLEVSR